MDLVLDRFIIDKTNAIMNLNHIAKKPFIDIFYKKPYMPHLLKAALYDAGTVVGSSVV